MLSGATCDVSRPTPASCHTAARNMIEYGTVEIHDELCNGPCRGIRESPLRCTWHLVFSNHPQRASFHHLA